MDTPCGKAVVINYRILTGKYNGDEVLLGFSFQGAEGYPEYPPHWIHISPPHDDGLGGPRQEYQRSDGKDGQCSWLALSRPPGQLWDNLHIKHMKHYLDFHINRFLKNLK